MFENAEINFILASLHYYNRVINGWLAYDKTQIFRFGWGGFLYH